MDEATFSHQTPIASRLELSLQEELRRMQNEWFFKWHFIGKHGPIEIDSFDGRVLRYNNAGFFGSAEVVYWDTIHRYLRKKLAGTYDDLERELKLYPLPVRKATLQQVVSILLGFANGIRSAAVEKDRILRGNGFEFPKPVDRGRWEGARPTDIQQRIRALEEIYGIPMKDDQHPSGSLSITGSPHARLYVSSVDNSTNVNSALSLEGITHLLAQLEVSRHALPTTVHETSKPILEELNAELSKPTPDQSKLRAYLVSLKTITEGAAGNLVAAGVTGLIVRLLAS